MLLLLLFRLLGLTPITQLRTGFSCQSYRAFLGENTDYLCEKIPQLHLILHQSNLQTRAQCQYHFRDHPWGCQLSSKIIPLRRFLRQGTTRKTNIFFVRMNCLFFLLLASKESSFYTTLASATLTWNLINACIKGQINDTSCSCSTHRQICQTDPTIAFSLAYLITDGLNMSTNFQQKFLFQLNQMNKEHGRKVSISRNSHHDDL